MLQNDWMARNKSRYPAGAACLVHCLVYTLALCAVYAAAAAESLSPTRLALFALLIFASHWAIDGLRLAERWGALLGQSSGPPVRTVVDQTMHLVVLAVLSAVIVG